MNPVLACIKENLLKDVMYLISRVSAYSFPTNSPERDSAIILVIGKLTLLLTYINRSTTASELDLASKAHIIYSKAFRNGTIEKPNQVGFRQNGELYLLPKQ